MLVGVADVDSAVAKGTPIDRTRRGKPPRVYAGVQTFPMLPEQLSTDLTSLNEQQDRAAVVMEFVVAADGSFGAHSIYRALVRNHAQLTYNAVGAWLEGNGRRAAESGRVAPICRRNLSCRTKPRRAARAARPAGRARLRPHRSAAGDRPMATCTEIAARAQQSRRAPD